MVDLTASVVLFKTNPDDIAKVISSVLTAKLSIKLYLVDNSPTDELKALFKDPRVEYIFNNANLGYGCAHNIAIRKAVAEKSQFHAVINPDIYFGENVLEILLEFMHKHKDVGLMMPKVLNDEGVIQPLTKLLPTPLDLFGRRFFPNTKWAKRRNDRYELRAFSYDHILNTPCLSGCFMFVRVATLQQVGLFDERYFMYLEDYDLTRRLHSVAKTIVYPYVHVIHGHQKESYKNPLLLKIHLQSAIKYFNRWGWFLDKQRRQWNFETYSAVLGQVHPDTSGRPSQNNQ